MAGIFSPEPVRKGQSRSKLGDRFRQNSSPPTSSSCLRVRPSLAHSLRSSRMPHTKPRSHDAVATQAAHNFPNICGMFCVCRSAPLGRGLATESTEFTERFFLLPSTRRSALQQGAYPMGRDLFLCVLGDLCGRNLLTKGRPKRSMAE